MPWRLIDWNMASSFSTTRGQRTLEADPKSAEERLSHRHTRSRWYANRCRCGSADALRFGRLSCGRG